MRYGKLLLIWEFLTHGSRGSSRRIALKPLSGAPPIRTAGCDGPHAAKWGRIPPRAGRGLAARQSARRRPKARHRQKKPRGRPSATTRHSRLSAFPQTRRSRGDGQARGDCPPCAETIGEPRSRRAQTPFPARENRARRPPDTPMWPLPHYRHANLRGRSPPSIRQPSPSTWIEFSECDFPRHQIRRIRGILSSFAIQIVAFAFFHPRRVSSETHGGCGRKRARGEAQYILPFAKSAP